MTVQQEYEKSEYCINPEICKQCKYYEPYHGMKFDNCERGTKGKYWKLKPNGSSWDKCTGFEKR